MFQTSHEYSEFHAAARCVSGGPIYFTDIPGQHDLGLVQQMTALNAKGERIILRPEVASSAYIYAMNREKRFLKIITRTRETKMAILGTFNVTEQPFRELVALNDFGSLDPERKYIIRSYISGKISESGCPEDLDSLVLLGLGVKGYDILTAYPLDCAFLWPGKGKAEVAVLGLVDKMTGAAAVLSSEIREEEFGLKVIVELKALGVLGNFDYFQAMKSMNRTDPKHRRLHIIYPLQRYPNIRRQIMWKSRASRCS